MFVLVLCPSFRRAYFQSQNKMSDGWKNKKSDRFAKIWNPKAEATTEAPNRGAVIENARVNQKTHQKMKATITKQPNGKWSFSVTGDKIASGGNFDTRKEAHNALKKEVQACWCGAKNALLNNTNKPFFLL